MANIIIKMSGQHSASIVAKSLAQSNNKSNLPSVMKSLGEAVGPFNAQANIQILNGDDVAANGIITILDYTKMTDGDTYQIGSLILTAKSSGASTNQFNIGASNAATATNLARAIGAYSSGLLRASYASAVVTITCAVSGPIGNAIAIIITQGTSGSASSDSALSSGANDSSSAKDYSSF